jgi:hypothetical protein
MRCKELEAVLESEGLSPLPPEAREHLASCTSCQDLLADFSAIVVAAKHLPSEMTPPDRVWVSIRAQLEAEGVIRDSEPVVPEAVTPWWRSFPDMFRPRVLAAVGTGLLVVFGSMYVVEHRSHETVAPSPQPVQTPAGQIAGVSQPVPAAPPVNQSVPGASKNAPQVAAVHQTAPPMPQPSSHDHLLPSPSERVHPGELASVGDPAVVLDQTETSLSARELANNPAVDAALRQNLRTLNEFIAECQSRLKQDPQDQLTREYLNMAYQQKAELLNAMMDTGRSEH